MTAEVHASFDYSPHRKQDIEEKTHYSNKNMTGCVNKDGDELNPIPQDNDGNDSNKICDTKDIMENVLDKKSTSLVDVTLKKQYTVKIDHISKENKLVHTKSANKELNASSEVEIDSDSTIIYDFPENDRRNKAESSADIATPNILLTSEIKNPMASSLVTTDKHTGTMLTKKTTHTMQENKALGSKTKKPGVRETEEVLRTKKDKKQGVQKTNYQQTKDTVTTKKVKTTSMKDIPSGTLPKFTYSSYKLSCTKKKKYIFTVQLQDVKNLSTR